jgi:hypothetical protein
MSRIRTIKPSFFSHEELSALPVEVHLLAAGLLCYADDEGFFHAHPKLVQAAVFPIRENFGSIPEMLRSLQAVGYLRLGRSKDGKLYGQVANFASHQRVSHPTPSIIRNLEIDWDDSGEIPEDSAKAPETLCPELKGIELNRTELNTLPQKQKCSKDLAEEIYQAYPRKVGKGAALKAIASAYQRLCRGESKQIAPEMAAQFLLASAMEFASSQAGHNGAFTPHPATWFNASRYLDDHNEWNEKNPSGGNRNGENRFSPATERINGARRVLAQAAIDRGLVDLDRAAGEPRAPLPFARHGGEPR